MANPNAPRQRGLPQIAQLPTAGALDGTELFETAQNYQPVKVSLAALAAYIGGGGGGPGGADTQMQYNNAGAFGGAPFAVVDGPNQSLVIGFNAPGDLYVNNGSLRVTNDYPPTQFLILRTNQLTTGRTLNAPDADGEIVITAPGLMIVSPVSLPDGAAAQLATLTNAPAVGDPTKWIPIDDNGTTRFIPAW